MVFCKIVVNFPKSERYRIRQNEFCSFWLRKEVCSLTTITSQQTMNDKKNKIFAFGAVVSIFLPYYLTAVFMVLGAIYVFSNRYRRSYALAEPFSRMILLVVGGWSLVAILYQNFFGAGVSLLLLSIIVTMFYIRSFMTQRLFNTLMDVACLCSLSTTIVAIGQLIYYEGIGSVQRAESVCQNPNYYGMLMEFMALIALYRFFGNPAHRKFYMLVMASSMIGIYLCASISAAAVVCAGVLLFFLLRGRYKYFLVFAVIGMLAALAALTVLPIIFPRAGDADHSMDQRLSIWMTTLQGIRQHLFFGQGPVTYELIYTQFNGYATHHAHNLILDTILNYGIVGAGLIGFFVLYQLRMVLARMRKGIASSTGVLLLVFGCMTFLHGMTDTTVVWLQTGALFLLVYSSIGIRSETAVVLEPEFAGNGLLAQEQRVHHNG